MQLSRVLLTRRTFSGIQPTGTLHLGNYLGAVRRWVDQTQEETSSAPARLMFCVVDQHAITLPQSPDTLRHNIRLMTASLLACGLNTERCILFQQSTVREHSELCWVLGSLCSVPRLAQLSQYKDKAAKLPEIPLGLFLYPVLQAADILLYKASDVPVGEDNIQNLQIAQHLAHKFNSQFCTKSQPLFPRPEAVLPDPNCARLRSLRSPEFKMSKSDPDPLSCIYLSDPPDLIEKKIKSSVTDSIKELSYDPVERTGVANLITIYAEMSDQSPLEVEQQLRENQRNKVQFKKELSDLLIEKLSPIQQELRRLMSDPHHIDRVISEGRDKATELASVTMEQVKQLIGFR